MKTLCFAISLCCLGLQGLVHGVEPGGELNEELAKRLIADVLDIGATGINIATVTDGTKRVENGFGLAIWLVLQRDPHQPQRRVSLDLERDGWGVGSEVIGAGVSSPPEP